MELLPNSIIIWSVPWYAATRAGIDIVADTRKQFEVEDWVRRNWIPTQYGSKWADRLLLSTFLRKS
jgi:hypothetical protein